MNVLRRIDDFFLLPFEKMAHKLQRLTGRTNFYYFGLVVFLEMLLYVGAYYKIIPAVLIGGDGIILARLQAHAGFWPDVALLFYLSFIWEQMEERAYKRLQAGLSNIYKANTFLIGLRWIYWFYVFPSWLVKAWLGGFGVYDYVFAVLLLLETFLIACDPLPPCKSKAMEWLKGLGKKPELVPIPIKSE